MKVSLKVKKLPFITGVREKPDNGDLPIWLSFELEIDDGTRLVQQKYSKSIDKYLKLSYRKGSLLSTPLGRGNFGKRRSDEVLAFILKALNKSINSMRILEVGCGDGYILRKLKNLGAKEIIGCEPGAGSEDKENKTKVRIIRDFFSQDLFKQKYDLVLSYGVLEHLRQPIKSLMEMAECTAKGGLLFAGVPNCERKLILGDPGILAHEHWNYFTPQSLKRTLLATGLKKVKVSKGRNGAMIYGWGLKPKQIEKEQRIYADYCLKVKKHMAILQSRIDKLPGKENDLGFYGGGTQLKGLLKFRSEPRLFDGDETKWGKYYPGFKSPIEPAENLFTKPVKELWITAIDYDKEIRDHLKKLKLPKEITIFSLKSFLKSDEKLR